jgi:hypothetical protein
MLRAPDKNEHPYFEPTAQHTFSISDSIALRIRSDAKPHNMKIADLQKGLIFLHNGVEVVGEGTGFGIPIVKYVDETVFSGSSLLFVSRKGNLVSIRKEFFMDLLARDIFRNLKMENRKIRLILDYFSILYQMHKRLARSILLAKNVLLVFGVKSSFLRIPSRGKVIVTYVIDQNRIMVNLNFSFLDRIGLDKVFVLNEQGTRFFRIYTDSNGQRLVDEEIGAWDDVLADSAKITDCQNRVGFSAKNVKGSILRRGREHSRDSLDWVGLDYEFNLESDVFEYEIEILGASNK